MNRKQLEKHIERVDTRQMWTRFIKPLDPKSPTVANPLSLIVRNAMVEYMDTFIKENDVPAGSKAIEFRNLLNKAHPTVFVKAMGKPSIMMGWVYAELVRNVPLLE